MNIDPKDEIAGQPIVEIRDALKFVGCSLRWHSSNLAERLWLEEHQSIDDVLGCLETLGYIEAMPNESDIWRCTPLGYQFSKARATRPIKRSTARRHLQGFMERVAQVNASEAYAYRVDSVLLFGSYLTSDRKFLSDLDLAVRLASRASDAQAQQEIRAARISAAFEAGRHFATLSDQLAWPVEEVWLFLRNRSKTIRLHDASEVLVNNWPHLELLGSEGANLLDRL